MKPTIIKTTSIGGISNPLLSKKKPSEILEEQIRKKETELKFISEAFENKSQITINKNLLEEMGLKKAIKKKEPPKNQMDFLEKVEKEKIKREEKEKLKLLEKLESQVLKIKKTSKINTLNTTATSEISSHKRLIDNIPKNDRIIFKQNTNDDKVIKFDKKLLDDSEFRKVKIIKKKIEIDCENENSQSQVGSEELKNKDSKNAIGINNNNNNNKLYQTEVLDDKGKNELVEAEDEIIENEYIKGLSKEKLKFFMFKAHQIYNFLSSIKLVRYIEIFIEDGFEDLESILEIDEDYFEEREYPEEHKNRIINKVNELREKNQILNGEIKAKKPEKTEMRLNSSLSNLEVNEAGIEADMNLLPANKEKRCCWNCLKVLLKDQAIDKHFEEKIIKLKTFCSDECLKIYEDKIYFNCLTCHKKQEKGSGVHYAESWFCNEDCIIEYIRINEIDIEGTNEDGDSVNKSLNEQENAESDEDPDYDPMNDF